MTPCCNLGLIRPHRHLKTMCPTCGQTVLDLVIASDHEEPPAVRDHIRRVLAHHGREHHRIKPTPEATSP